MSEWHDIKSASGNLVEAAYDANTQQMQVKFRGGRIYRYDAVPEETWKEFADTFQKDVSSGSWFDVHIKKGGFAYSAVDDKK